ncbi:MAG: tRNA-dihydrouridine synthase [Patescibacteria group bacterium]
MAMGFWAMPKRPILALAPMANVTDAAFRRIIAEHGKPDVLFTEFVSADGLCSAGRERLLIDLAYGESERPIVAQLFSGRPDKMYEAAKLVKKLGFDGLDINMGCPDRAIEKSGAGAALIKNPRLAREIIRAAKEGVSDSLLAKGAPSSSTGGMSIPVSIKTRLGYNKDILEEWLPELLAEKPAAIAIHARTRKEMSKVPAHWERVKRAVEIRDGFFPRSNLSPDSRFDLGKTLILGNGDVMSVAEAREQTKETGADGIMLGRAIFGNPWLLAGGRKIRSDLGSEERADLIFPPPGEKLRVMAEHAELFEELFKGVKSFSVMKKHFKAYVQGFEGAKGLRQKLMETESAAEVEKIVADFLEAS